MWRDGGCLSKRKERQNGVWVSLPACAYIMVTRTLTRARSGCGANKKMAHDQLARLRDLRRAEDPQVRVDDFVQRKDKFFFVVITVSVDGKEA